METILIPFVIEAVLVFAVLGVTAAACADDHSTDTSKRNGIAPAQRPGTIRPTIADAA